MQPSCNPAGIALTGKASRKVAKRGSLIRYTVTVANTNKTPFDKGGVEVTLPAGVTYQKSRASPRAKNTALDTVVVTGNTVTLPDAPLKGKGRRRFTVYAKVDSTAVAGSDLAFAAATCSLSTTSTVRLVLWRRVVCPESRLPDSRSRSHLCPPPPLTPPTFPPHHAAPRQVKVK